MLVIESEAISAYRAPWRVKKIRNVPERYIHATIDCPMRA
jgi:hypothetical protein